MVHLRDNSLEPAAICNLNTSNVMVHLRDNSLEPAAICNLNTSNVMVHQAQVEKEKAMKQAFKYI